MDTKVWRYGCAPAWARYTARLCRKLRAAGIEAERFRGEWYANPQTRHWAVRFPATQAAAATRIADRVRFPRSAE